MGLFNWLKKNKEVPVEDKGWIDVRVSFYLDGKIPKKSIENECTELIEIFMNGQSFFNQENEYLGYGNLKVNPEGVSLLHYTKVKEVYATKLSKLFFPDIEKVKDSWHIVFMPHEENGKKSLYKIGDLYKDLFILWNIDKNIRDRYKIGEGTPASFDFTFMNKKPSTKFKEKLMTFECKIEDQIKYEVNPLVIKCLGDTAYNRFKAVRSEKPSREMTDKEKENRNNWLEEATRLFN